MDNVFGDLISQVAAPVIAMLVPLVIEVLKKALSSIPSFLLPILAAVLGPALDQILSYIGSIDAIGWQAALLGAAGVGIREIVVQLKKVLSGS